MKTLTREQLRGTAAKVPSETVPVPALGGAVIVRGLTAKEAEAFYQSLPVKKGSKPEDGEIDDADLNFKLVTRCIVDAKGARVFEDGEYTLLQNWPSGAYQVVLQAVQRVNGMGPAGGNSPATAGGDSSSG